ncbi:MAG: BatD family protein [Bacteroidales bacterium]|nr:BatD family protein [Bacteroidales bacterium]
MIGNTIKILKTAVASIALALFCFQARAEAKFTLSAPAVVSQTEQFRITFTIDGDQSVKDFAWDGTNDFEVVWGPSESSSSSFQIINGKTSKSVSKSYSYVLLPKNTGSFTIPAATARVGNSTLTSNTVRIEVLSAQDPSSNYGSSSSGQSSSQGQSSQPSQSQATSSQASDLFMTLELSKRNVVVGESITATLKLYQRTNIVGFENASFPKFEGFWSNETYAPNNIEFSRENYNGVPYDAAVLRRYTLIPQHSGNLTIAPAELVALVNVRRRSTGNSLFDDFFDTGYSQERRRLLTKECVVKVSELPAGAPASFAGAVGTGFKISAAISKDVLSTHEAAVLKVRLSGTGNISLAKAPSIQFPLDFECYDPKSVENLAANSISGTKTYEYPIIPRSSGDFVIDPVEYTYFDTSTRKYVTLATDAIPVTVLKGAGDDNVAATTPGLTRPSSEGVRSLAEDIRYIATGDPEFKVAGSFFVFSPIFWGIILALAIVAVILAIVLRRLAAASADVVATKNRKASKAALAKLKLSKNYLDRNIPSGFYEELHRALVGYVCDKLGMPISEFTKENVASALAAQSVPQQLIDKYLDILNACEIARYSPSSEAGEMAANYEDALNVITSMDSYIKSTKAGAKKTFLMALLLGIGLATLPVLDSSAAESRADSLWNTSVAAYSDGRFSEALDGFASIYNNGLESPKLLTNIGDCHYKLGNEAYAVLFYKRALRLDPGFKDAKYNLEIVGATLRDRIDVVPEFIFKTWNNAVCYSLTSNAWAVLCVVFFVIFLVCLVLFIAGRRSSVRKTGFFTGIVALLLSLLCLAYSAKIRKEYSVKDEAVITMGVVSVKNAPASSGATDLFILHEGTVVRILDRVGSYYNIEIADGRNGWLPATSMEVI